MESKNLLTLAITLTVGIILAGSLLMPVISDATKTEETFANDNYFRMAKYTTEDVTISFDADSANVVTVNDEEVALPARSSLNGAVSLVASEIFCLRYNPDGTFQCFSGNSNTAAYVGQDWTLVISSGTATFTNVTTEATRSETYENVYVISNEGDWAMKKSAIPAYMNGDSFFMGVGLTAGSSAIGIVGVNMSGDIDNGATIVAWRGTGITFSDIVIHKEAVNTYIDLYKLDRVTFTATDAEADTLDITYSYFIVPYEVTAELANHLDNGQIAIMNALPVLIIVALVMMAAGALYLKRDD